MQPAFHHVVMLPFTRTGYLLVTGGVKAGEGRAWNLYDQSFSEVEEVPDLPVTEHLSVAREGNKWLAAFTSTNDLYVFTTPRLKFLANGWDSVNYEMARWSPTGDKLYVYTSSDRIGYITYEDLASGIENITYLTGDLGLSLPSRLAVNPDGTRVAVAYSGGMREFSTSDGTPTGVYEPGGSGDYIQYLEYSTSGQYLAGTHQYDNMVDILDVGTFEPIEIDFPANNISNNYNGVAVYIDDEESVAYVITRNTAALGTFYMSKYAIDGGEAIKVYGEQEIPFSVTSSDSEIQMLLSDDERYMFVSMWGNEDGVLIYDYPDMVVSDDQIDTTPGELCFTVDVPEVGEEQITYTLPRSSMADINTIEVSSSSSEDFLPPDDWEQHDYLLFPVFTRDETSLSSANFTKLSEVEVGDFNQRLLLYYAKVADLSEADFPLTVTQSSPGRMGGGIFGVTTGTPYLDYEIYEKPGRTDTYSHPSYPVVVNKEALGNLFLFSTKTLAKVLGTPSQYYFEESSNLITLQRLAAGVQDTFWEKECYVDMTKDAEVDDTDDTYCCDVALYIRGQV